MVVVDWTPTAQPREEVPTLEVVLLAGRSLALGCDAAIVLGLPLGSVPGSRPRGLEEGAGEDGVVRRGCRGYRGCRCHCGHCGRCDRQAVVAPRDQAVRPAARVVCDPWLRRLRGARCAHEVEVEVAVVRKPKRGGKSERRSEKGKSGVVALRGVQGRSDR